jgi:hypothetical protein
MIGHRHVCVPGHLGIYVDELRDAAGSLTNLAPFTLQLSSGETVLLPGSPLSRYASLIGPVGLQVTVLSRPERDQTLPQHHETSQASLRINNASPQMFQWGVNRDTRVADSTLALNNRRFRVEEGVQSAREERVRHMHEGLGRPGDINPNSGPVLATVSSLASAETSYLIITLVYEDGHTATQVVWPTMQIRHLCLQVGEYANVSPDTVFCYYAGSVLDAERRISDPPAIREGARVHVFFSLAQALQFVVLLLQGADYANSYVACPFWSTSTSWICTLCAHSTPCTCTRT